MQNIKSKACFYLTFSFFFGFLCSNLNAQSTPTFNDLLADYNVEFKFDEDLSVIRNWKYPNEDQMYHTIVAEVDELRVEIEIVNPISQEEAILQHNSKHIIIQAMFKPQVTPYSGAISHTSDCAENFYPKKIVVDIFNNKETGLIMDSNDRYGLGICDSSLVKYKAGLVVHYDKLTSSLYTITVFKPISSFTFKEFLNFIKNFKRV